MRACGHASLNVKRTLPCCVAGAQQNGGWWICHAPATQTAHVGGPQWAYPATVVAVLVAGIAQTAQLFVSGANVLHTNWVVTKRVVGRL